MTAAAIYTRISNDREGAGLGVARQEKECRELCEGNGWDVVEVFTDNDVSAYSGKRRKGYEELLNVVRDGKVDAIVAWHTDRLHRTPRELEDFIDVVEASKATVATVQAGPLDLTTPSGRMVARQLGAVARYESEHKAARARSKHAELARNGLVSGGGSRPFGYTQDRRTINRREAKLVREAARRILDGEGLTPITRDWKQRGITGTSGKTWKPTPLKNLLMSARIAGYRERAGELYDAEWKGIIDKDTLIALRRTLSRPQPRGRGRRYLLTGGLAVCGRDECGAALHAKPRANGRQGLACINGDRNPKFSGCGKIGILAETLDDYVRDSLFEALDTPDLVEALSRAEANMNGIDTDALWDQIQADESALQELSTDYYGDRRISRSEYLGARDLLEGRIEEAKREAGATTTSSGRRSLPASRAELERLWEKGDVAARKQLVTAFIDKVLVGPAVRGRAFFDPDRVTIVWRL